MSEIVMPKFGLTMTEGQITAWHRQPGEAVKKGEILFEVETDKVTNEVEAAFDGILTELLFPEGSVVPVGEPIARMAAEGEQAAPTAAPASPAAPEIVDAPSARKLMAEHGISATDVAGSGRDGRVIKEDVLRVIATPLAKRLARIKDVNLAEVTGSGPRGRIKAADVQAAADAASPPSPVPPAPEAPLPAAAATRLAPPDAVRAATARRVQAAKRDIPHFYLTRHVNIGGLNALRAQLNGGSTSRAKISVTHLLAKAVGLAMAAHPALNRVWMPDGILELDTVGVGIVTETPQGLRIPIIDRADALPLDDLAIAAAGLFERARSSTLTSTDVSGGAISISNVGMFGADTLTPIISPPQSMILGVGAEQQLFRPDPAGHPVLCREIILTLAADHRLIDGADAARFLSTLASLLEAPFELLRSPSRPAT